ncbi:Ribosomal protein L35, non-mitochondrial [Moorella glycerini]|uniref:Large ribosomal subunit protein bL35 n=2 Tax=Neomoorella TaxID=44260 RepID=A0A9X7J0A7_9FIRM|nr:MULTISPECIES: 50S ribosomal protein L35 [Moorella]KYH32268.1 50S ribosomal protein L35 [Moorella mulderi DSM 14980]PRR69551.1 50S ribosomal protein L35 [Moorella stamsii]CEP68795.1 Ribosomal protein L35, non-mitochondrial [Moorella glycerini]
MPKMKTHRGAAKRFRVTASGKVKRARAYKSHLLAGKAPKRKRRLRQPALIDITDRKRIARLLPYQA